MARRPLHPRARTTRKVRSLIQKSPAADKDLAKRYGVNVKTIAKWRRRDGVDDARPGRAEAARLTPAEEAVVVFVRKWTRASLETLLAPLQRTLPDLTRSQLYRCWANWKVERAPRNLPKRSLSPSPGAAMTLRLYAHSLPSSSQTLMLAIGGGWIDWAIYDQNTAAGFNFLSKIVKELRVPLTEVITPYDRHFCLTDTPSSTAHAFRKRCIISGISHTMCTDTPDAMTPLRAGWSDMQLGISADIYNINFI